MLRRLLALASLCAVAACSRGAATLPPAPAGATSPTNVSSGVRVTVTIPVPLSTTTASTARRPNYIPPSTKSVSISFDTYDSSTGKYDTVAASQTANCANGGCTVSLVLTPQYYQVTASLYDAVNASGSVLATLSTYAIVGQGIQNNITLAFSMNPTQATIVVPSTPIANGVASSFVATPELLDASGAIIPYSEMAKEQPYLFFTPTNSSTHFRFGTANSTIFSISATDLAAGKQLQVQYDGAPLDPSTPITISLKPISYTTYNNGVTTVTPAIVASSFVPGAAPPFTLNSSPTLYDTMQTIGYSSEGVLAGGNGTGTVVLGSMDSVTTTASTTLPTSNVTVEAKTTLSSFSVGRSTLSVAGQNAPAVPAGVDARYDLPPSAHKVTRASSRRTLSFDAPPAVGTTRTFTIFAFPINGTSTGTNNDIMFTLRGVGPHALIWTSAKAAVPDSTIPGMLSNAEAAWQSDTTYYGTTNWSGSPFDWVGATCDASGAQTGQAPILSSTVNPDQVNILSVDQSELGAGVGGYFAATYYETQAAGNCWSPIVHTPGGPTVVVSSGNWIQGFAHEEQHLIHFVNHSLIYGGTGDPAFIDEGMAREAERLVSRTAGTNPTDYTSAPQNVSFPLWRGGSNGVIGSGCLACYDGAGLFVHYLEQRFGTTILQKLTQTPAGGFANLSAATGVAKGQDVLRDFYGMLAVGGKPSDGDPRYTFNAFALSPAPTTATISEGGGPVTLQNVYQGAPIFIGVTGSSSAAVKATDSSGLLQLDGLLIRQ